MSKYNATVTIELFPMAATSKEQAEELFREQLQELAGSNTGSELLANAKPVVSLCESCCAIASTDGPTGPKCETNTCGFPY